MFEKYIKKNFEYILYILIPVVLVGIVLIIKYKNEEIDYLNSDATWHTLLTIKAYDETPISIHKFLPLVSLGKESDKNISWGVTVPDKYGNYYYTSFSPAGFVMPYLFIKLFNLPITELSLYLFNMILFASSAVFWVLLIEKIYKNNEHKRFIMFIAGVTYIFSPELFHGLGIVYWHQSLFQLTLSMQFYFYYKYKYEESKNGKILFWMLCFINPYVEWTGFVANFGFLMAEFVSSYKINMKKSIKDVFIISFITILSAGMFVFHYLLNIDLLVFINALKARFLARNFTTNVLLTTLLGSYFESFLYLWIILFLFIFYFYIKNEKIEFRNRLMIFVFMFPILENIIMKQHALSYTYDKMKFIFILSYFICDLTSQIIQKDKNNKIKLITISIIVILSCTLNLISYKNNSKYIWNIDYKKKNQLLANYVIENYPNDRILITSNSVRGYLNLLFGSGIYEGCDLNSAIEIAKTKSSKYVIEIKLLNTKWNLDEIFGYIIYDTENGKKKEVSMIDGNVVENDFYL